MPDVSPATLTPLGGDTNPKFKISNLKSQIQNLLTCKLSDDNSKETTLAPQQEYLNCFTTKLHKNGKD